MHREVLVELERTHRVDERRLAKGNQASRRLCIVRWQSGLRLEPEKMDVVGEANGTHSRDVTYQMDRPLRSSQSDASHEIPVEPIAPERPRVDQSHFSRDEIRRAEEFSTMDGKNRLAS